MRHFSIGLVVMSLSIMTATLVMAAEAPKLKFGESKTEFIFGRVSRHCITYAPNATLSGQALPLMVLLHGTGDNAESAIAMGHFYKWAELEGFIAVAPQSLGQAFNDGSGRGGPEVKNVDDVRFIQAVINDVKSKARIDGKRM